MNRTASFGALLLAIVISPVRPSPSAAATATEASSTTAPTGRVVDNAGLMTPADEQRLTERLAVFEYTTKHQFIVVTLPSLGSEDIATFTRRLANRWGIGRKGVNDGVVLLVAPNEHKIRIAVGHGLERALPNAVCAAIIAQQILPHFKEGKMAEGIDAGVGAIIDTLQASKPRESR
jgi:uncharacterized protein